MGAARGDTDLSFILSAPLLRPHERGEVMNPAPRVIETAAIAVAALLLAVVMPIGAMAATATGNCVTTGTEYRVTDTPAGTTSTNLVTMPQSGIAFVQGGSVPGCVVVTFAAVITTASTWMFVSATLDGNSPIDPNRNFGSVSAQDSRTTVFVFPNVAPGSHTIVMKFRSQNGGNVTVYNRTATVSYRR
jgi:hypothetical protein